MTKTIAHITDIHLDEAFPKHQSLDPKAQWQILLEDLKERKIKEVVFGGDIGENTSLPYFFQSLSDFDLSLCLGNHDEFEAVKPFIEPKPEKEAHYYYEDLPEYRFVVLDSSLDQVSEKQLQMLEAAVQTDKNLLLAIHHPVLPVPSYIDAKYALKDRDQIKEILHQVPGHVTIICGHYHLEDERNEGNIRQLLTPASSYLLEKAEELIIKTDQFGYRLLEISPESLKTNVIYLNTTQ